MRWGMVCIMLVLAAPGYAAEGKIKLLAVSDENVGLEGSVASLSLETRPGSGRVFLETFPLSKTDTQISMRFAKQVACNQLPINCDEYDFIYTLRANSVVIGGPSAGAAATVLTYAVLVDLPIADDIAITGSINSGGLIGGVGGIQQKIVAAGENNIKTVIIPSGKRIINEKNQSVDLVEFGAQRNVKVIEVKRIDEALGIITGRTIAPRKVEVSIDPGYASLMRNVSMDLCDRAQRLKSQYQLMLSDHELNLSFVELESQARRSEEQSAQAFVKGDFYSAASFCFRAGINYHMLAQSIRGASGTEVDLAAWRLREQVKLFGDRLRGTNITTLTDVQTSIIVDERLSEAQDTIDGLLKQESNLTKALALAQATERVESAVAWSRFFGQPGVHYEVDPVALQRSCEDKIREAEERYQYVQIYIQRSLGGIKQEIERAGDDLFASRYELCLSKAAKAKAEADVLISLLGTDPAAIIELVDNKLAVAKVAIADSQAKGIFPILGYSYYQFAGSLKETDPQSAILFAEYALEFSNLDLYFQRAASQSITGASIASFQSNGLEYLPWILGGIIVGMAVAGSRRV
ncbi:hypothetical protein HY641_05295 [Candidatus Woesearchaeota archaeon]|nr:hypothetical protein [Candidatus Woesearchaeota archaeon]